MHNHMQNKQRSCTLSRLHPVGNQLSQYASSTQTKEVRDSNVAALEGQNPFTAWDYNNQKHALHIFAVFVGL